MNKPATKLDYGRRIDRVIRHIDAHLDDPLDLDRLAEVACFSPCHFHRIYRYLVGETPAETLRRMRLHRAAGDLTLESRPLPEIARRSGYGSVAAFTRAFGSAYGMTPARYRQLGRLVPPLPDPTEAEKNIMYQVTIKDLPSARLAAMRHVGPYMDIGGTFDRLSAWAGARGLFGPDTMMIGIYIDDPGSRKPEELRADAGITVGPDVAIDGDARLVDLAGGRHAVLRHQGPYAELERPYRWLYGEWLSSSGREPADRPPFEIYVNDPHDLPPSEWLTDICLPLKEG